MKHFLSSPLVTMSLIAFALAMFFEGFSANDYPWPGWACLILGWYAVDGNCVAWLANPLLFLCWMYQSESRFKLATISALGSLALMLTFLGVDYVAANEGGVPVRVSHIGIGYWIWIGSALSAVAAAIKGIMLPPLARNSNEGV